MSGSELSKAEINELVATLGKLPRFAGCSRSDLEVLAKTATPSTLPANWPLINEQTPSDACYVILDGEVEVRVDGNAVAQLGTGSVVGEVGLLTSKLRNATVFSVTRVSVLNVQAETFHSLVSSHPALKAALQGPSMEDNPS